MGKTNDNQPAAGNDFDAELAIGAKDQAWEGQNEQEDFWDSGMLVYFSLI